MKNGSAHQLLSPWKRHPPAPAAFEARRAGPPNVSPARKGWDTSTKHGRAPEVRRCWRTRVSPQFLEVLSTQRSLVERSAVSFLRFTRQGHSSQAVREPLR